MIRYIVYLNIRQFKLCDTLVEALEWKTKLGEGALVYEPLGVTAFELSDCQDLLADVVKYFAGFSSLSSYQKSLVERANKLLANRKSE